MRKRNKQFLLALNDEEFTTLTKHARLTGYTKSAYIRALIMGFIPKVAPTADFQAVLQELRAIGNSMNQIAARANSIGFMNADDYLRDSKALWAALMEIQSAFLPENIHGDNQHMED